MTILEAYFQNVADFEAVVPEGDKDVRVSFKSRAAAEQVPATNEYPRSSNTDHFVGPETPACDTTNRWSDVVVHRKERRQ